MPSYFVTATGTDIGKTFVTCGLIRHLQKQHYLVSALKPVISGWDDTNSNAELDTYQLIDALGLKPEKSVIKSISPWRFQAVLSPDMAAKQEGRTIDFEEVVSFCRDSVTHHPDQFVLIEGAGGVMVPLSQNHLMSDLMKALGLPVILVAGTYLGTLSHSLTAYHTLKDQGIIVDMVILSESEDGVDVDATVASLKPWIEVPIFTLRRRKGPAHASFQPIIERLVEGL